MNWWYHESCAVLTDYSPTSARKWKQKQVYWTFLPDTPITSKYC